MYELIKLLFEICLLKKAPQNLPYSFKLLKFLVVINLAVNFLLFAIYNDWPRALLQSLFGLLLIFVLSYSVLFFTAKLVRFFQTTCALLGVDTLISFFATPGIATAVLGQGGMLVSLVMLGLVIWHWVIIGHIIRNAIEQSLSFSLGLAFLYQLGAYQLMALLFPEVISAN